MPTQSVTITVPQPFHLVDMDAVRLAAAKQVTPGATDSHGVEIRSIQNTTPNSTSVALRVNT